MPAISTAPIIVEIIANKARHRENYAKDLPADRFPSGQGRSHALLLPLAHLHSDPVALRTLPFSLLVIDVPLEFFHGDFAALAGHDVLFVTMIALHRFRT
jgi:hypothetical protein